MITVLGSINMDLIAKVDRFPNPGETIRGNDFATSAGFTIEQVRTLPQGLSDHLPILITAHVTEESSPTSSPAAPVAAERLATPS